MGLMLGLSGSRRHKTVFFFIFHFDFSLVHIA